MVQNDTPWWDEYSDQPYRLAPGQKPGLSLSGVKEYLTIGATTVLMSAPVLWRYFRLRPQRPLVDPNKFIGLSVSPDPRHNTAIFEMLDELGVQEVLMRTPVWDLSRLEEYVHFVEQLEDRNVLINVLQDKECVAQPNLWCNRVREILKALSPRCSHFQIGNAINRRKWGCRHSGEYLDLLEATNALRNEFPEVKFIGSSVSDFEPLVTARTLWNRRHYQLDIVSALLYVNRRGSPMSRQYKLFDLYNKLRMIYAIVLSGNRNARRLWITEFNWPLLDTRPYTPNSGHPDRTVDEATQARYLKEYYEIAYATGWVEKVYWWQLINPGYGLVDHRGGQLRKHPSYFALKDLVHGGLHE